MEDIKLPDLPELTFEPAGHIYRLNGVPIPSVSQIMEPLSRTKYKGINADTLDKAAQKGTAVHEAIETFVKFQIEDVPPEHEGYFEAFMDWWDQNKPVVIGSEVKTYHKIMRYAGTVDLLAIINGELTLIDLKTTSAMSDLTFPVQLCAYEQALATHGVEVQSKLILQLKKDGNFTVRTYPTKDALRWRVFGALKTVYDYIVSCEGR